MEKKKNVLLLLLIAVLLPMILLTGCGDKDDDDDDEKREKKSNDTTNLVTNAVANEVKPDDKKENNKPKDDYDFSQYEKHGDFSDGLAWVCVSDYTGIRYGYINRKGEYVIPLSEEIKTCRDYEHGIAIVTYKSGNIYGNVVLYDTTGTEVARIDETCGADVRYKYLNNGNIVFGYPIGGGVAQDWYFYVSSTKEMKNLKGGADVGVENSNVILTEKCADYSEGMLYSGDEFASMAANGCSVRFLDENGELALYLGSLANENYKAVYSATDFKDGKSDIIFLGQNSKRYTVTIDKTGKWLTEPKEVDNEFRVRNDEEVR